MKPKEIFWSGLKGGLFEEKHRKAMGEAIWFFGWLVTRQSQVQEKPDGTLDGLPHYGKPMTDEEISADTGFPARSIQYWRKVLIMNGYLRTVRVGNLGLIYFISKAKKKARNPKPSTQYFHADLLPDGNWQAAKVSQNLVPPASQVSQNLVGTVAKSCTTCVDKPQDSQQDEQPLGGGILTPTDLSNYKRESRPHFSLQATARELQPQPTERMSEAELEARQRELRLQGEEIRKRFPPKEQPGKVVEMQPKEAIA